MPKTVDQAGAKWASKISEATIRANAAKAASAAGKWRSAWCKFAGFGDSCPTDKYPNLEQQFTTGLANFTVNPAKLTAAQYVAGVKKQVKPA